LIDACNASAEETACCFDLWLRGDHLAEHLYRLFQAASVHKRFADSDVCLSLHFSEVSLRKILKEDPDNRASAHVIVPDAST
jgi:hypothetical protein